MSKVAVIVAVLIMLVLGGVALLVTGRPKPTADEGGPFLKFDPARVTEIRISRPLSPSSDGGFDAVRRGSDPGDWQVIAGGPGTPETASWPAATAQVRAALRILSTLAPERPADAATVLDPSARTVTITLDDRSSQTLQISPKALGGKVLAKGGTGNRAGWVGADVGQMLAASGPRDWRDRTALPGLGPEVSRITLRSQAGVVSLGRIQGKWALREPIAEPAEHELLVKLLAALQAVRITDFLDDGPPASTGVETPAAELTIESDTREGEGPQSRVITTKTGLSVGQVAEIGGKTVFAKLWRTGSPADYAHTVILSGEELAGIKMDPAAYISRKSLALPAADIGGLLLTLPSGGKREYHRSIDGWTLAGNGAATPVTKSEADAIAALLRLLTQIPAEAAAVSDTWPQAWGQESAATSLATVEIRGIGGEPIAAAALSIGPLPGKSPREGLIAHASKIWRGYSPETSADTIAWTKSVSR